MVTGHGGAKETPSVAMTEIQTFDEHQATVEYATPASLSIRALSRQIRLLLSKVSLSCVESVITFVQLLQLEIPWDEHPEAEWAEQLQKVNHRINC